MVWFFERFDETIEIETRYDNASKMYVLERRAPGQPVQIERLSTAAEFRQRLLAIEASLSEQCWRSKAQPLIVASGWPVKTPHH